MLQLRDYQEDLKIKVLEELKNNQRTLLQLPTGAGKTLVLSSVILELIKTTPELKVLVIVHKRTLAKQLAQSIEVQTNIPVGILANKNEFKRQLELPIQVATIQTLQHIQNLPQANIIAIDEAHHTQATSYTDIYKRYPSNTLLLGLTATPYRQDNKSLADTFDLLLTGPKTSQLIEQKYLCDFTIYTTETLDKNPKETHLANFSKGELAQIEQSLDFSKLNETILKTWEKFTKNESTVIYPISVSHSRQLRDVFTSAGYKAAHIEAHTKPKERNRIIEDFKAGKITILCQHSILIEGLDIPSLKCVAIARPMGLVEWFQSIGRGLRTHQTKDHCKIIDFAGNYARLPIPDEDIKWHLDPEQIEFKHSKDSKSKTYKFQCPQCLSTSTTLLKPRVKHLQITCPQCLTLLDLYKPQPEQKRIVYLKNDIKQIEKLPVSKNFKDITNRIIKLAEERQKSNSWILKILHRAASTEKLQAPNYSELRWLSIQLEMPPAWASENYPPK